MSSAAQKEPPVLASLAAWPAGATQPVCDAPAFRGIHISESHCFPPQPGPLCWVYVTLNAEIARNRSHDAGLRSILEGQRARTSVDSQWIWWALQRRYGSRAPRKMSGSDLIHTLAQHCAAQGRSLLLLGSAQQANDDAVHALRRACPGLHVTGFAPRAYVAGGSDEAAAWGESLAVALATAADFVVIGLSPDKQYRLAAHLAPHLDGMTQGLLCFGGAIDMASGRVKRAPLLWQRLGVESIYRILQQPSRLPRLLRLLPIVPQVLLGRY